MRLTIFLLAVGAFAADLKPVIESRTFDLAAGGTIHLENAAGNVEIEGWDQPRVELTTVKTAGVSKLLDKIKVTAEKSGNELKISSEYPKYNPVERPLRWTLNFGLEYRIKAPRTAKLVIEEYAGEVNIREMTGDIHATDRNGDIALVLPEAKYAIDARSRMGAVISDFAGKEQREHLFGHEFEGAAEPASKLYLRARFGDIMILKMRVPKLAD